MDLIQRKDYIFFDEKGNAQDIYLDTRLLTLFVENMYNLQQIRYMKPNLKYFSAEDLALLQSQIDQELESRP